MSCMRNCMKIPISRLVAMVVGMGIIIGLDHIRDTSCPAIDMSLNEPRPIQPWDEPPLRTQELGIENPPGFFSRSHPLVLMRNNVSISDYYHFPHREFSGDCSCLNPHSKLECCDRTFRRTHKMGCVMSMNLLQQYPGQYKLAAEPKWFTYNLGLPETDYRDVIVLRDLYSSILSGYLYHHKGFECNMPDKVRDYLGEWDIHISYELKPPRQDRTICQYIARTKTATGMRAYMDWVMRYYYSPIFSHWALAQEIPEMKERTLTICYEDLMSKDKDQIAVDDMVNFFFNGTPPIEWDGTPPGHAKVEGGYKGGHSTTNDRSMKEKINLIEIIKNLDQKYYHGEIEWLNSINPCSKENLERREQKHLQIPAAAGAS